jgi:hypothetical protein
MTVECADREQLKDLLKVLLVVFVHLALSSTFLNLSFTHII